MRRRQFSGTSNADESPCRVTASQSLNLQQRGPGDAQRCDIDACRGCHHSPTCYSDRCANEHAGAGSGSDKHPCE
ncbi:MAG: hypothetical protein IT301_11060 [Dehalococcoidia bacterium]|nr:hypothetical protein [Dehalococcoidia bacterium]